MWLVFCWNTELRFWVTLALVYNLSPFIKKQTKQKALGRLLNYICIYIMFYKVKKTSVGVL